MELMQNVARQQQQSHLSSADSAQQAAKVQQVKQPQQVTVESMRAEQAEAGKTKIESQEDLQQLVKQLNQALDPFRTSLRFGFDNSQEVFYVSVIESQSDKIIRRFPAEQAVSFLPKVQELTGILFDEKG